MQTHPNNASTETITVDQRPSVDLVKDYGQPVFQFRSMINELVAMGPDYIL